MALRTAFVVCFAIHHCCLPLLLSIFAVLPTTCCATHHTSCATHGHTGIKCWLQVLIGEIVKHMSTRIVPKHLSKVTALCIVATACRAPPGHLTDCTSVLGGSAKLGERVTNWIRSIWKELQVTLLAFEGDQDLLDPEIIASASKVALSVSACNPMSCVLLAAQGNIRP